MGESGRELDQIDDMNISHLRDKTDDRQIRVYGFGGVRRASLVAFTIEEGQQVRQGSYAVVGRLDDLCFPFVRILFLVISFIHHADSPSPVTLRNAKSHCTLCYPSFMCAMPQLGDDSPHEGQDGT